MRLSEATGESRILWFLALQGAGRCKLTTPLLLLFDRSLPVDVRSLTTSMVAMVWKWGPHNNDDHLHKQNLRRLLWFRCLSMLPRLPQATTTTATSRPHRQQNAGIVGSWVQSLVSSILGAAWESERSPCQPRTRQGQVETWRPTGPLDFTSEAAPSSKTQETKTLRHRISNRHNRRKTASHSHLLSTNASAILLGLEARCRQCSLFCHSPDPVASRNPSTAVLRPPKPEAFFPKPYALNREPKALNPIPKPQTQPRNRAP